MADFKDLELLVAKIQKELAPTAKVLHDQKLPGRLSKRTRQIDVLVKDRIGQYEIQIIIDCKDYRKPADVKSVEEFDGLLKDVGAQKGVLVCPNGFSAAAKTRAEGLQIDLYSPFDTDPHKWKVSPFIPTICDFRSAMISFGIGVTGPHPFQMPYDFQFTNQIYDEDRRPVGTMFDIAIAKWNNGDLPKAPGEHSDLPIYGDDPRMDNGFGTIIPVKLWANLHVEQELYYGQMPITKISGFKDELKGAVITNAFEVGILDPNEITKKWKVVGRGEKLQPVPVLKLQGLVGWDEEYPERNGHINPISE